MDTSMVHKWKDTIFVAKEKDKNTYLKMEKFIGIKMLYATLIFL